MYIVLGIAIFLMLLVANGVRNFRQAKTMYCGLSFEGMLGLIRKLGTIGYHNETLIFEMDAEPQKFVQFRRFALSDEDRGVDIVCPIFGNHDFLRSELSEIAARHEALQVDVPTLDGANSFLHVEIMKGDDIDVALVDDLCERFGMLREQSRSATYASTFRAFRKRIEPTKVFMKKGDLGRYDLFPEAE